MPNPGTNSLPLGVSGAFTVADVVGRLSDHGEACRFHGSALGAEQVVPDVEGGRSGGGPRPAFDVRADDAREIETSGQRQRMGHGGLADYRAARGRIQHAGGRRRTASGGCRCRF